MPIILNQPRGKSQVVQQVQFGTGDILMLSARDLEMSYENQLWLVQHVEKPQEVWETAVDEAYKPDTQTDDMPVKPTVVLYFTAKKSIRQLMKSLNELYLQYPDEEDSTNAAESVPAAGEVGATRLPASSETGDSEG